MLSFASNAPKMWLAVSPLKLKHACLLLGTSSFQGDNTCNGTHDRKALSDPHLFEDQFEELVTELTEKDLTDPVLADALSRLKEVRVRLMCVSICSLSSAVVPYIPAFTGFGVQCTWRQEEPRPVCDWLTEGASPTHSAHPGHGAASSVDRLVH